MKKLIVLTAALLVPTALNAQEEAKEGPKKGPRGGRPVPAEILEKFDADKDGKLNEEERAAARKDMLAKRKEALAKFDADGDGKLNPEERKAAMVARFDADGDGTLNETEQAEADKVIARRRGAAEGRGKGPKGEGKGKGKGPKGEKKGPKGKGDEEAAE